MNAYVVYESHWGNTAAVANAIAAGLGPGARAVTTDEVPPAEFAAADLLVAGAPLIAFGLPSDGMLDRVADDQGGPVPPDVSHPSLRHWLTSLPHAEGRSAAFETRIRWSPGSAAKTISSSLERAGYRPVVRPERFVVKGKYGPLAEGELERARAWGERLAATLAG